MEAKMMMCQKE